MHPSFRGQQSGAVNFKVVAGSGGDGVQVAGVGADDQVAAAERALDDASIDDVAGAGAGGEGPGGAGASVVEGLGVASGQEPGQQGLAAAAAPRLGQHGSGHRGNFAAGQQSAMTGPLTALTAVSGDQGAGVVGNTHQALRRSPVPVPVPVRPDRSAA
jgi:hypothetical protein